MSVLGMKQVVVLLIVTLMVSDALAQSGGPLRQRRRDGSCMATAVQASAPTSQPAARQAPTTCPMGFGPGFGGPGWRGRGMGGGFGMPGVVRDIHVLLSSNMNIHREVIEVPGGVLTTTTSTDPQITETLRKHVRQMQTRLENGQPIRMWDPLFVEFFRHGQQIHMAIEDIPGGVRVLETSDDPQVTSLVRQHATQAVSRFAATGWENVHQPTTLPVDYQP